MSVKWGIRGGDIWGWEPARGGRMNIIKAFHMHGENRIMKHVKIALKRGEWGITG
jgi:hypothetical protein